MNTHFLLGLLFAAISGVLLAIQAGCNATLGKLAGRSFSSVVSFGTGLACMLIFFLIDVGFLKNKSPLQDGVGVAGAPWWTWTGGIQGGFYVVTVIIFSEHVGASTLMGSVVSAQQICALILDTFGLVGFPKRKLMWPKLLGVALTVVGVVLVAIFRGDTIKERELLDPVIVKDDLVQVTVRDG